MNPNQCEACRFQNKPCHKDCIFAPLFPSTDPYKFEVINSTFVLETLTFFLKDLSPHDRKAIANTFYSEAEPCFHDPINVCSDRVTALRNHANQSPQELAETKKLLSSCKNYDTRSVVLALPAMSQRHLWMDLSETEIVEDCQEKELLEPSVNGKDSDYETKPE